MKKFKYLLAALEVIFIIPFLVACWNYREIDGIAIVAGVAIDKDSLLNKYIITVEIIDARQEIGTKVSSRYVTLPGDAIFETSRKMISIAGKKLYWGHAKSIIISEPVAKEGITKIIDWFVRDSETRTDMDVFIAKESSAKDILFAKPALSYISSFELSEQLKNEVSLSTTSIADLWKFLDEMIQEGISASIATVTLDKKTIGKPTRIDGIALFKKDKLIGTLDGDLTKYILFSKNELKGGILKFNINNNGIMCFEIFNNVSKINPILEKDKIKFELFTDTIVAIDENQSQKKFNTEKEIDYLEKEVSIMLSQSIYASIKKIQEEYGSDIFGFGTKIYEKSPEYWNKISNNWDTLFTNLEVTVNSKVTIKNSASLSKPIEIGD